MDIHEKILEYKLLTRQLNALYKEIWRTLSGKTSSDIEEKHCRCLEIHHELAELYKQICTYKNIKRKVR